MLRALVSPDRTRNATVNCLTPVHAIEVSREDFDKYLAASETGLALHMREKDKMRALNRTKNILRRQRELRPLNLKKGEVVFRAGDEADEMYIVEDGLIDSLFQDRVIVTTKPGEMLGVGALITHRKRNTSAACASESCRIHTMKERDFFHLMDSSPMLVSCTCGSGLCLLWPSSSCSVCGVSHWTKTESFGSRHLLA
jgi:CRP-like cAMP-binding protein